MDRPAQGWRPLAFAADPDCTPGYYNNEGQPDDTASQIGGLGFLEGPVACIRVHRRKWRSSSEFAGLEFR